MALFIEFDAVFNSTIAQVPELQVRPMNRLAIPSPATFLPLARARFG